MKLVGGLVVLAALFAAGASARPPAVPSYALPSWSPDGKQLVFARAFGPSGTVVLAGANGKGRRWLLRTGVLSQVAWSPKSKRIAYASRGRVFVIQSNGKGRRAVGNGADLAWGPDGVKLAFTSSSLGGPIRIANAGGGPTLRVTDGPFDHAPAWSPDGTKLAFTRAARVAGLDFVYVVGVDGAGLERLGPQGASPAWSPDGRMLAFWQRNEQGVVLSTFDLALGFVRTITRTFPSFSGPPRWSPDGKWLLVTICGSIGQCRLDVAAADGSEVDQLVSGGDPAWSPDGTRIAFVARRLCRGSSVWVVNVDGSRLRRITPCR